MKTKEEWSEEFDESLLAQSTHKGFMDFTSQIQQDAFAAGQEAERVKLDEYSKRFLDQAIQDTRRETLEETIKVVRRCGALSLQQIPTAIARLESLIDNPVNATKSICRETIKQAIAIVRNEQAFRGEIDLFKKECCAKLKALADKPENAKQGKSERHEALTEAVKDLEEFRELHRDNSGFIDICIERLETLRDKKFKDYDSR